MGLGSFSHRARLALPARAGTWGHSASLCHYLVLRSPWGAECPTTEQDSAILEEVSLQGLCLGSLLKDYAQEWIRHGEGGFDMGGGPNQGTFLIHPKSATHGIN